MPRPPGMSLGLQPTLAKEESFDVGDSTFRKDNISINNEGLNIDSPAGRVQVGTANADELEVIKVIGRGCSSYVQHARHIPSGEPRAIKMINLYDKAKRDQLMQEIKTLCHTDCPCLVKFHGAFYKDSSIGIVLEFMNMGSLDSVVEKRGPIPERALAGFAYQIFWGLAYLKYEHSFHRDVKPQNILCNDDGQVKLTDFGIAKEMEHTGAMATTFVGTFKYMSPERIQSKPYNYKSDIWSAGIVLIELATGHNPYSMEKLNHIELVQTILESPEPQLPAGRFSPGLSELVSHCMKKDPEARLPADILLAAPWFTENGATNIESSVWLVKQWLDS